MYVSLVRSNFGDMDINTGNTHAITTRNPSAQTWFDRGCAWAAGFHREEASHCFQQAVTADPSCAMAYWGLALMNGPDYNFSKKAGFYGLAAQAEGYPSLNVATTAANQALALASGGAPREEALTRALASRYEWPVTDSTPDLQERYAEQMEKVALSFPSDADIQAVCAEALLCLSPWDLYERDKTVKPIGKRIKLALDRGLQSNPSHLWLCHLKTHYSEMGCAATRVRQLVALSTRSAVCSCAVSTGQWMRSTGTRRTCCAERTSR